MDLTNYVMGDTEPPEEKAGNVIELKPPAYKPPPKDDDVLRPLPHAVGPEKAILSVALQFPEKLEALESLPGDFFYLPAHNTLLAKLIEIRREGKQIELLSLVQRLHDDGLLDRLGGAADVYGFFSYQPSPIYFDQHLEIVAKKHAARSAILQANKLIEGIYDQPDEAIETIGRAAEALKRVAGGSSRATVEGIQTTSQILSTNIEDDETMLIGHKRRFLGKSGSFVIAGPSGIGKSTLTAGFLLHAAAGIPWNGITFRRPLKILVVQAENDDGDLAEMMEGAIRALQGMTMQQIKMACENIVWRRLSTMTGEDFTKWLEKAIAATGADLAHIDPLLAYVGDDISSQKVASNFFRNLLQPVLDRTGAMTTMVHHTGKTSTDSKARENWSESDFAYLGFGSSELTNWARAVAVLVPAGKDTGKYKFLIAKRGKRAGMIDAFTKEPTTSIILTHSDKGMGWVQAQVDDDDEPSNGRPGAKPKITTTDILKALSDGTATRRDVLTISLADRFSCSQKLVSQKIDMLLLDEKIFVHSTEKRPRGGHPIEFLAVSKPT